MLVAVAANAVAARHISLILNSARQQQRLPVQRTRRGPVRHIERQIVVVAVAREHREAQVVADLRQDAPAAPLQHFTRRPWLIVMMLVRHAEQVPLVILVQRAVRLYQQKAVHRAFLSLDRRAAAYQRVARLGVAVQPLHHLRLRQRTLRRFHGESGREHLRQQNQIAARHALKDGVEMAQVRFAIHPVQGFLQNGNL